MRDTAFRQPGGGGSPHQGLALRQTLPATPERAQQELTLRLALGIPSVMTKGLGSPEGESLSARARELRRQMGNPPQLFPVLMGSWRCYFGRRQKHKAQELAEQRLVQAQRVDDRVMLLYAHALLTQTFLVLLGVMYYGRRRRRARHEPTPG